ncbi:MAG: radical SAM protein, partial [Candidatus Woesearchaeota archaeon]
TRAGEVYAQNFPQEVSFERAIFISWGCSLGDCSFCYMSTQPESKRVTETCRSTASILAECILCRELGWDIGFVTGGIGAWKHEDLLILAKHIHQIVGKFWLSIGPISEKILLTYKPYICGVVGSIETINPELHAKVCPSKPISGYEKMFTSAQKHDLKRAMTFIVGLGETHNDFSLLKDFIEKNAITKIHVYGLIPQKGTPYENVKPPSPEDEAWWIAQLRISFPGLDIQCGIWHDRAEYLPVLLQAGANSVSKLQALKVFGSNHLKNIVQMSEKAGRTFRGELLTVPSRNWDALVDECVDESLQKAVKEKLKKYLNAMNRSK